MKSSERCPKCFDGDRTWRCIKRRGHEGNHLAYVPVSDTAMELRAFPQKYPLKPTRRHTDKS